MRTTPRVILILKQASSAARLHKTLAQKQVLTFANQEKVRFEKVEMTPLSDQTGL